MNALSPKTARPISLPGIEHRTLAGAGDGLTGLEMWMQTLAPGTETPVHRHDCEEVVLITDGNGTCLMEGETVLFGPMDTLVIPAGVTHQILNTGTAPLHVIAAFSKAGVRALTPDGVRIDLPWD